MATRSESGRYLPEELEGVEEAEVVEVVEGVEAEVVGVVEVVEVVKEEVAPAGEELQDGPLHVLLEHQVLQLELALAREVEAQPKRSEAVK